jgi:Sulfotransferase family
MPKAKNIIILSEKSSGSSACQNLLARVADVRHVAKTRHFENETLYWTKAASILGKPQIRMVDSEIPLEAGKAREDLITLLRENLENYVPPEDDAELIFHGWQALCRQYSPIFIEKSPHHLCQWSALELIAEHIRESKDVDFLVIGLIRNPLDTIYSQCKRWFSSPRKLEEQWQTAYRNLLRFKEVSGLPLMIVRYEDIVSSLRHLDPAFEFCEVSTTAEDEAYLHENSLRRWKNDVLFGYTLSDETIELAERYGYRREEMLNVWHPFWGIISGVSKIVLYATAPVRRLIHR